MNLFARWMLVVLAGWFALAAPASSSKASVVDLIANGNFESGLSDWSESGTGSGFWSSQTGTQSPLSFSPVPLPPVGDFAAMVDAIPGENLTEILGTHVLTQTFVVPNQVQVNSILNFYLLIQSDSPFADGVLDHTVVDPNQQVRVDVISSSADVFSTDPGDILQSIYLTNPIDPTTSGYDLSSTDVTALLNANLGSSLTLRFATVNNQGALIVGVDDVELLTSDLASVPEPSALILASLSFGAALCAYSVRKRRP